MAFWLSTFSLPVL